MTERRRARSAALALVVPAATLCPRASWADQPAPAAPAAAAEPAPTPAPSRPEPESADEPAITVVGSSPRALERVPGSASVVTREDLRNLAPQHAGDVLRTLPGVNVVGEDNMGLRLNISIRGLDPNRSRKVLVLEDGMPVSLNPYGSPELYYTPPIERMDRVEVVRGSGQILWGPQTVGGVINYITRDPPRRPTAFAEMRYGSFGYLFAHAGAGATFGAFGFRVDVMRRSFEGPRRLDLGLTDVTGRLRLQISERSVLRVKANFYDEGSRATYVGPSTAQFASDPRFNGAINDRFLVQRFAFALMHEHRFSPEARLQTNFYAYETNRAWRRQEFERTDSGADYERVCDAIGRCGARGTEGIAPTADRSSLFFRNLTAIRNRAFLVSGIEPRLTVGWSASRAVSGELVALARFHYERAREQILISQDVRAEGGDPRDEEHRNGYALALALQHRFSFWNRLHVTPGLRVENFWSDRRVVRVPAAGPEGAFRGSDVNAFGGSFSSAFIPGLGVSAELVPRALTVYTGVHRGYAPPRTKDAVSSSGVNLELDPELSWNTELGVRARVGRWFDVDVAAFHLEFQNQIIPPSESGAVVSGGSFNTGHSRHTGLEASTTFDLGALLRVPGLSTPMTVNYTWLPVASFVDGLFDGNRLPYAPTHLLNVQWRVTHRVGFAAQVGLNYVAAQFADKENTPFPSNDGLVGEIPAYVTLDARVAYSWRRTGLTFSLNGRNLTNQVYIASRAPQGIQPAGWRQLIGGVEWTWPGS